MDNLENLLSEEKRTRINNEKDIKSTLESENARLKVLLDQNLDGIQKLLTSEHEYLQSRIKECSERISGIENELGEIKNELSTNNELVHNELDGKLKVLDAKIEDVSDRLRYGMNKLQAAVGEVANTSDIMPLEETEGIRESLTGHIAALEERIKIVQTNLNAQEKIIVNRLKTVLNARLSTGLTFRN